MTITSESPQSATVRYILRKHGVHQLSDLRVRQICLVAHDLARVEQQLTDVFGLAVGFRDPRVSEWGLHNFLIPVGNQLLETVSPLPDRHDTPGGRYLKRRGGDGGYMVILQVPRTTFMSLRERVSDLGIRVVAEPGKGQPHSEGMQLHPKDVPGAILAFRWSEGDSTQEDSWPPAGSDWQAARRTQIVDAISAAEIQCWNPETLAGRWSQVLDVPVVHDRDGNPTLELSGTDLRFVPVADGRPEGLSGLDLRVTDAAAALANAVKNGCLSGQNQVSLCGMRLRLV